jgi:hypothetical protein
MRLEITVDDALFMGGFDGLAQALAHVDDRRHREWAHLLDIRVQIEPRQVFADHVLPALRSASNVIGADHAGMLD